MKNVAVYVIALLLSAGIWSGSGFADSAGQEKKAPAQERQVEKIGLEEARKIVAARVNGVDITLDQVIMLTSRLQGQISNPHSGMSAETIQREALDRVILQELAWQHAKALGMSVEQKAVDAALAEIKEKAGEKEYKKALEQNNITEDQLRAQVEKNLILESVYKKEVLDKIKVPEEKITEEYEKNKGFFSLPEKISIIDVVISSGPSDKETETRAEDILKKIRDNGNDPHKLVQDNTFTVRDYEPEKNKDKEMIEAARKLKPGDISGVMKLGDSLHIIKLVEYQPEKVHPLAEVKGFIENKLRMGEQQRITREWSDGLKKDAKIEILMHEVPTRAE
jgi:parvulin-like peptidyl-prolyl isomerase